MLLNILQCTENDPNVSIAKGGELGTQTQVGGDAGLGLFKMPRFLLSPTPPHRSTLLITSEYAA